MKKVGKILIIFLAAGAILTLALFGYYFAVTNSVTLDREKLRLSTATVKVYDDRGNAVTLSQSNKEHAAIEELPAYVSGAFVSVEDKRFYSHHGLDYKRIIKAIGKNIASFSFREGASTISQQLIKNTHLTGEKTVNRKLKELKLTRILEKNYSKSEIIELYINSIYFGHDAFGIADAARFYFDKETKELSPAESAMLAALVKSPNRYSPFKDADRCLSRRNFVLKLMYEQGYIRESEYTEACSVPLPTSPTVRSDRSAYDALVLEELSEIFPDASAERLRSMNIYTFLNADLQAELDTREKDSDYCAVVIDNKTHGYKAYSASKGTPMRSPASAIKPLLVYAPAVEENIVSPATPILDEKIDFNGYSPSNSGGKFNGYISARYALSHSINIPAVKLLNTLGCEKAVSYLEKLNLHVPQEDYSLALALGGMSHGFTTPALTQAYSALACGGAYAPARAISYITDENGKEIFRFHPNVRTVFSEDTATVVSDMLQSAVKEGTAKKLSSLPYPVYAKTGTAAGKEGNTDAYTFAYTAEHTVGVWMGNADYSPIRATGGGLPANFVLDIFKNIYRGKSPEELKRSESVCEVLLDRPLYDKAHRLLLADPAAPPTLTFYELFKTSAVPTEQSSYFSHPKIETPQISVKNNTVVIELCQTEYYEYIIKRENGGKITTVYQGKYPKYFYDNSVHAGTSYTYTVIPMYNGIEGDPVSLPSVRINGKGDTSGDWWID